jgi:phosphoglycolate phosphatase
MKYPVNLIIFDFDGVIIDSGQDIASAVQHVLKLFDQPVLSREEIIGYIGHGVEYLIRKCFKSCDDDTIKQVIPIYRKHYLENAVVETRLYEHVEETLEYINKPGEDNKIALVTNKPEDLTYKILDVFGVKQYFDMVVGPESVKKMKPDPEGILQVLEQFKIPPQQAIMVGDSHVDVEAGKNAGTVTCGVTYGLGNREELIKSSPDILINDLGELLEHIENIPAGSPKI